MKMFKTFAVIGVLASAACAYAGDDSRYLHVNVPFAFIVGSEQFAPGNYDVRQTETGIVTVQGQGKAVAFLSAPLDIAKAGEASGLRFTNNASREYLSAISMEGEGTRSVPVHFTQSLAVAR
jgi:hypothetical protein